MTHIPHEETGALTEWAAEALDQMASLAQGALDVTAWVLVAALLWHSVPQPAPKVIAPGPMATTTCTSDCIETITLTSGS